MLVRNMHNSQLRGHPSYYRHKFLLLLRHYLHEHSTKSHHFHTYNEFLNSKWLLFFYIKQKIKRIWWHTFRLDLIQVLLQEIKQLIFLSSIATAQVGRELYIFMDVAGLPFARSNFCLECCIVLLQDDTNTTNPKEKLVFSHRNIMYIHKC